MNFKSHNHWLKTNTKLRLLRIHRYFVDNPGCTINNAVTFIPETQTMVQRYSKNKDKFYEKKR